MSRTHSELVRRLAPAVVLVAITTGGAHAQEGAAVATPDDRVRVLSSEIALSRSDAELELHLSDGRSLNLSLGDGAVEIDGETVGSAARGSELDGSWRALLQQAMDTPSEELSALLIGWEPPAGAAAGALDRALENALSGVSAADQLAADEETLAALQASGVDVGSDSVVRLVERITELQTIVSELEREAVMQARADDRGGWPNPLRHIGRGLAGIFSLLVTFAVLFGIGFATVVLGGRRFLEGVGDTARNATVRSGLVGLAATFLVIPAFVLGIIALVISIVGIPALLVFVPLFPLAVVAALTLGYLGVAHAAGEAFAERRFSGEEWYRRGNSYYFLLAGLGVLLALFLGAQVLEMTGPWLGFIRGIFIFLGTTLTWAALTIGFGAVLISRGGSQPVRATSGLAEPEMYAEETHV